MCGLSKRWESLKKRLAKINIYFIQGWSEVINNSSRENAYKLISRLNLKCCLDFVTIQKFRYAYTGLRVASPRL